MPNNNTAYIREWTSGWNESARAPKAAEMQLISHTRKKLACGSCAVRAKNANFTYTQTLELIYK